MAEQNENVEMQLAVAKLAEYHFEQLSIDVKKIEDNIEQQVKMSVTVSVSKEDEAESDRRSYRLALTVHLEPAENADYHEARVGIIGTFLVDGNINAREAESTILSDGAQELYTIVKANVYSITSGALMMPSMKFISARQNAM